MTTKAHDAEQVVAETPFPSAETMACPYPYYKALHDAAPVNRLPSGEYVISRHADVFHATRHPEIFSSRHSVFVDGWMRAATLEDLEREGYPWQIVMSDPPEHTLKRRLAFEMFKPGRLRGREPLVREQANHLIDGLVGRSECEFVGEFADLLPASIILTLFGLPLEHVERALEWGRYEGFGTRFASPERQVSARDGMADLREFLRDRILERVDSPGDDDLSLYVQSHVERSGSLDLESVISDAANLFIGGIITTTHLLSSMMLLFIRYPEQQAKAREDWRKLKTAVEEALRIESPTQLAPRLVLRDTEVGGVPIVRGSIVLLVWGAANRDGAVFEDADTFDVDRGNVKDHLGFGNGPHFCMGAPLARMEATVAFEQIFARMTNLRFAEGKNDFQNHHAVIFRGPERLYIEFDEVAPGAIPRGMGE
jgi:cytochrome P450